MWIFLPYVLRLNQVTCYIVKFMVMNQIITDMHNEIFKCSHELTRYSILIEPTGIVGVKFGCEHFNTLHHNKASQAAWLVKNV